MSEPESGMGEGRVRASGVEAGELAEHAHRGTWHGKFAHPAHVGPKMLSLELHLKARTAVRVADREKAQLPTERTSGLHEALERHQRAARVLLVLKDAWKRR